MTAGELAGAALAAWSMTVAGASAVAVMKNPAPVERPLPVPPPWNGGGSPFVAGSTRSPSPAPRGRDVEGAVLVIRPCAGDEPSLSRALASSASLRGETRFTLVFAVARDDDPALPVARAAREALRGVGVDAGVTVTRARGVNQKASQLAAVIAGAPPHEVVVVIDSDVDCAGIDLDALVAPLSRDPSLAAVWAPVVEAAGSTLADRASEAVLAGSLHGFPLLSRLDAGGMVGKVVALRSDALARVGGFASLDRVLGEDMELARRLRDAGLSIAAHPRAATSLASGRSWSAVVDRYARWITVIRAQRPALLASYPGMFFATWLIAALGSVIASLSGSALARGVAVTACALALCARLAVAVAARGASGHAASKALADVVLADAVLASAFVKALSSRTVHWRGRALRVDRGGVMSEVTGAAR